MNKNLLIVGAGQYGLLVQELARTLQAFEKIDFLDDNKEIAVGKLDEYKKFVEEYSFAFPAIGNAELRMKWIDTLEEAGFCVPVLVSPSAYVSCSAQLHKGTVVEPMAVVQSDTIIGRACIISANATVNHNSICEDGCHIDCGAVVGSNSAVPRGTKVKYGEVFEKK